MLHFISGLADTEESADDGGGGDEGQDERLDDLDDVVTVAGDDINDDLI